MSGDNYAEEDTGKARKNLETFLQTLKSISRDIIFGSLIVNITSLLLPLAIMQVYDRIIPHHAVETLVSLSMVIATVVAIETLMRVARSRFVSAEAMRLAWRTQQAAIARVFSAETTGRVRVESSSRSLDRLQSLLTYAEWQGSQSRLILLDLPFALLFLMAMALVGGPLVLIPIALFAVLGLAAFRRGDQLRKATLARAEVDMKVRDFLTESLNGIATIKAGAMEPQMVRRFERLQETVAAHAYDSIRLTEEAQAFAGLLANLVQMMTVSLGAVIVIEGGMTIGTLVCCTMLAGRAVQPLLRCVAVWNEIQLMTVSLEKAKPLLELPPAVAFEAAEPPRPVAIQLSNVVFAHTPGAPPVVNGLSLDIPAGSIIAITGPDGSGKTTLMDLIMGIVRPQSGQVLVDGQPADTSHAALKQRLAVIRAGSAVVHGTVLENISMFRTGDAIESARAAARSIGLEADIERLPLGYETPLLDGIATEIPAGMMQRITIARALARQPGLLIIDEANATLDMRADRLLAAALSRLGGQMTILLVTNRPSFAAIADQVITLENGRIVPGVMEGRESAASAPFQVSGAVA